MSTRPVNESADPLIRPGLRLALYAALLCALLLFGISAYSGLALSYTNDYGEGSVLLYVSQMAAGDSSYSLDLSEPTWSINVYPPVHMMLQVPFYHLFGPAMWYGRAISLISMGLTALFISATVWLFSRDRLATLVTASIFLSLPLINYWGRLNRVDSLALMLAWAGLSLLFFKAGRWWALGLAVLCFVAAAYTRQSTLFVAPLSAFVWLWSQRLRRQAIALMLLIGALGIVTLLILDQATEGGFYYNVVTALSLNKLDLDYFTQLLGPRVLKPVLPLLAATGVFALVNITRPTARIAGLWALIAYFCGAFFNYMTAVKAASSVNYFLDMAAILTVWGGLLFAMRDRSRLVTLGLLCLLLQFGLNLYRTPRDYYDVQEVTAMGDLINESIRETEGPILSDFLDMLLENDKAIYLDSFIMGQLAAASEWDSGMLVRLIEDQHFTRLIFASPYFDQVWDRAVRQAIEVNYALTERLYLYGEVHVYQPIGPLD